MHTSAAADCLTGRARGQLPQPLEAEVVVAAAEAAAEVGAVHGTAAL